jgi:glycine C-acetyltransferase
MSYQVSKQSYVDEIAEIKAAGLWKTERVIVSEQKNDITLEDGANVVNMCANNYLGLA